MVPFAGWNMPVQYTGIPAEHRAVREAAGIFDISHMGQILARGENAGSWLNGLLTNDLRRLSPGEGQYTLLLNDAGGVIDDLIIYRTAADEYFLVVNASKTAEDFAWLASRLSDGVKLDDLSAGLAGMAVQGPRSQEIYKAVLSGSAALPPRNGIAEFTSGGGRNFLCRTGYTGEDGFEFFCPAAEAEPWWDAFLKAGAAPCGLGARDTLRLEMGYPLNGNDLSPDRTPLEAGLGVFVNLDKSDFPGSSVLRTQKESGVAVKLAALKMIEGGPPPRAHYAVYSGDERIGELCSGGVAPSLGAGIAMAYLPVAAAAPGTRLTLDIRGKRYPVEVVRKPFYRKPS